MNVIYNYSADEFGTIWGIIKRVREAPSMDAELLRSRLDDLIAALGLPGSKDPFTTAFHEFATLRQSEGELAATFGEIAGTTDKLLKLVDGSEVRAELGARLRDRDAYGSAHLADTMKSLAALRAAANTAKVFHIMCNHEGAPRKTLQDTALIELATLFIEVTGQDVDSYDLPHSRKSLFIPFVVATLSSLLPTTEASPTAIAKRWKRLKDSEAEVPEDES